MAIMYRRYQYGHCSYLLSQYEGGGEKKILSLNLMIFGVKCFYRIINIVIYHSNMISKCYKIQSVMVKRHFTDLIFSRRKKNYETSEKTY